MPGDLIELEPQRIVYRNYDNDWAVIAASLATSIKEPIAVDICKRRQAEKDRKDDSNASDTSLRSNMDPISEEMILADTTKKLESL